MEDKVKTHPVQTRGYDRHSRGGRISQKVTMKAYEVYCHVYQPQEAMVTGGCRGGFSAGELIAFLYASSFPKTEWSDRMKEAFDGMVDI